MGPPKPSITISQEAFDEMVKENIDDLEMDPTEALQDAIQTLTLQGVDLSGIVTCKEDPVIRSLDRLKQLNSDWVERKDVDEVVGLLDELTGLCLVEGSGNAAIGTRNGGIELVCSVCSELRGGAAWGLDTGLKALASLLHDVQSRDTFQRSGGPKMLMAILSDSNQSSNVVNGGFSVVAAAATANEIVKESFMELKIDELMLQILRTRDKGSIHSLYDAIRVLLTPDDNRVVASQVYGYARQFAKIGIAEVLVDSLKEGLNSPSLVSATIALKAVAVNDEICRSIAETGGVDAVLRCIDDSGVQSNNNVARVCCSLLCKLAGSDANKSAIVQKGGMDRLIKLAARFSDDPSVLQEVMSVIAVLSLRAPDNAARAIEAGAGDLAIQAMQSFPGAHQMQRNACSMIRNLAVRNLENRTILLNSGIEKLIRKARENHESCSSAATDALRDLGLDDYNK